MSTSLLDKPSGVPLDDPAAVALVRERKLQRIKFEIEPVSKPVRGEAISFLTAAQIEEFQIPDDVPVSSHPYGGPILELVTANPDKLFLDVGAGLRDFYHANVINLDIFPAASTDVISIGERMPFADSQFDYVMSFAVLEHVRRPWDVAQEMCRILKPGGTVIADYPFMSPMHGYPHHYFNATISGNRSLFEASCDVRSVDIGHHHHPVIPLQWMLTCWHSGLTEPLATTFSNMTVREFIDGDLFKLMELPVSVELHQLLKQAIAGGSTVTAVKRSGKPLPTTRPARIANTEDLVKLRERSTMLTGKVAALEKEIQSLRGSTSWRITEPLRSIARLLGKT